jgi:hypothetical protein
LLSTSTTKSDARHEHQWSPMSPETTIQKTNKAPAATSVHYIVTSVMGIDSLGCPPHWTSPLCEVETFGSLVYQMTASRDQAHGQDACEWRWHDECLVVRARSFESQEILGRACSSSWNCPVRTRMPCWCGEGGQETGILTRCYEYFVTPTCSSNAGRSSGGRFARW